MIEEDKLICVFKNRYLMLKILSFVHQVNLCQLRSNINSLITLYNGVHSNHNSQNHNGNSNSGLSSISSSPILKPLSSTIPTPSPSSTSTSSSTASSSSSSSSSSPTTITILKPLLCLPWSTRMYKQINCVEWMCKNHHYTLLAYKLKRGESLVWTDTSLKMLAQGFKQPDAPRLFLQVYRARRLQFQYNHIDVEKEAAYGHNFALLYCFAYINHLLNGLNINSSYSVDNKIVDTLLDNIINKNQHQCIFYPPSNDITTGCSGDDDSLLSIKGYKYTRTKARMMIGEACIGNRTSSSSTSSQSSYDIRVLKFIINCIPMDCRDDDHRTSIRTLSETGCLEAVRLMFDNFDLAGFRLSDVVLFARNNVLDKVILERVLSMVEIEGTERHKVVIGNLVEMIGSSGRKDSLEMIDMILHWGYRQWFGSGVKIPDSLSCAKIQAKQECSQHFIGSNTRFYNGLQDDIKMALVSIEVSLEGYNMGIIDADVNMNKLLYMKVLGNGNQQGNSNEQIRAIKYLIDLLSHYNSVTGACCLVDYIAETGTIAQLELVRPAVHIGGTTNAIDNAHSAQIAKWVFENRTEGYTVDVLRKAVARGDVRLVDFILGSFPLHQLDIIASIMLAINQMDYDIFNLLACHITAQQFKDHVVCDVSLQGYHFFAKYLKQIICHPIVEGSLSSSSSSTHHPDHHHQYQDLSELADESLSISSNNPGIGSSGRTHTFTETQLAVMMSLAVYCGYMDTVQIIHSIHPEPFYIYEVNDIADNAIRGGYAKIMLPFFTENRRDTFSLSAWRDVGRFGDGDLYRILTQHSDTKRSYELMTEVHACGNIKLLKYLDNHTTESETPTDHSFFIRNAIDNSQFELIKYYLDHYTPNPVDLIDRLNKTGRLQDLRVVDARIWIMLIEYCKKYKKINKSSSMVVQASKQILLSISPLKDGDCSTPKQQSSSTNITMTPTKYFKSLYTKFIGSSINYKDYCRYNNNHHHHNNGIISTPSPLSPTTNNGHHQSTTSQPSTPSSSPFPAIASKLLSVFKL